MFFLAEEYGKLKHEWEAANILFQNAITVERQQEARLKLQAIGELIHEMDLHVQVIDYRRKQGTPRVETKQVQPESAFK
jgi:hypothetical protein